MTGGARVALLVPYWSFFEPNVPGDLRADRLALADELAGALAAVGDVVAVEVADGEPEGAAAGRRLAKAAPDAVVVAQTMAVPPTFALAALDELAGVPLVVCPAVRRDRLRSGFSHADVTTDGATVGTPQLTNVLVRRGRPFALAPWRPGHAGALRDATRAAAAAGRVRRARVLRVGSSIPGYACVDADAEALRAATGVELVPVAPADVRDAYLAAGDAATAAVEAEARRDWALGPGVEDDECLRRSARFAVALGALDDAHGAAGGVMNCHVDQLRFAPDPGPGITPCWALGRETSRGLPWTCSGDVLTIVAMLALKALGAAALYHEIEALDHETGDALLANTGEHDLAFADPRERPALVRNRWFDDADPRCGACACLGPPAGPATLVGFTEHPDERSGFRFVVAEGSFTGARHPETGTPNAAFRFGGREPVGAAWTAWAATGVNHHSAASPGHHGDAIAAIAGHLGVGCVQVSSGAAADGPLST